MPGGRPSKLTPEVRDKIIYALKSNGYIETAASFAGINKDTYHEWMKRGARESRGIYREFSDAIKQVLAEWQVRGTNNIQRAANGYEVVKTRTVTEQKPITDESGKTVFINVTTTTEERSKEFAWQAQAWLLERRFPNLWGRKDHLEVGGDPEQPLQIEVVDAAEPQRLAQWLSALVDVQWVPNEVVDILALPAVNDGVQD